MPHLPAFLAGAPSMPAGSHEMREYNSNQDPPRSAPHTAPSVTPYLGLRARLSQVWINRWTILLLLVLARTLLAIRDLNSDLGSAKREALSACSAVEDMGSTVASMPHYMSQGVNELAATGIEKAVNGLYSMATLSVTGVEEIVVFVINLLTSTYLCLITLAVSGSLHAVISVAEDANAQLKDLVSGLGDDMANTIEGVQNALNDVKNVLNGVAGVFSKGVTIPSINLTADIDKVRAIQIPAGFDTELQNLNKSIPNFAQVQNFTDNAIRIPFELLKSQINQSLGTYTFDRSVFPVPQKEALTFCSDNNGINGFFNDLVNLMYLAKKIFIGVVIILAILACIPMGYREVRRWRSQQDRARLVGTAAHDPLDVVYIVSRPYTSGFGIQVSSKLKSIRRQALVRWVVAYATTEAALFVLALGLAGLFTCLCQYILLKQLQQQVPQLSNQVGDFADKVVSQLNNASASWSASANNVIIQKNQAINDDMFGWVNQSVDAINNTLNTFVSETTKVLNATFGGTVLYGPITEVFNCLIGLKIVGIEKALTWVEDNAQVNFPLLPNDTFSLGAIASIAGDNTADQSFLAAPGDDASDAITAAVLRVTTKLYEGIETEALISTVVLMIWVIIVLIGIIRAMFLWFGRDKTRGEGGAPNLDNIPEPTVAVFREAPLDFTSDDQDRFKEIPLNDAPNEPAPHYSREDPFGDDKSSKLGYAGHRENNQSIRRLTSSHSDRASYYPNDTKI